MVRRLYSGVYWFTERYALYLPTIGLIWGLIWDTLTLRRPDSLFENAAVLLYLTLSAGMITLLNLRRSRGKEETPLMWLIVLQFAFGNLTSGLFILYAKSGTFAGALLFFVLLGALLLGNELFRDRYSRIHIHTVVWYVLLLAYCIISVPIVINNSPSGVYFNTECKNLSTR